MEQALLTLGRPALVADELTDRNAPRLLCNQGDPLANPDEAWPTVRGTWLVNILNIHTLELPFVPAFLSGAAYWSLFIAPQSFEQSTADGTLVVRSYDDVSDLTRLAPPEHFGYPPVRLRFQSVTDYPSGFALADCLPSAVGLQDQFPCRSGIKLGGYPHMVQGTAFLQTLDPDFQVQLDCSDYYMYADSGIGFVYAHLTAAIWESL